MPLSLYVHIPWCLRKCPYCDFNSHAPRGPVDEGAYVDALLADLAREAARGPLPSVDSVFIGGGTPSLFEADAIGRLLDGVDRLLDLAGDAEITLEANPGAAEARRFAGYRAAGVNRLSIGVQSLDDAMLRRLGRVHSARDARAAVELARAAGFDDLNLDLMFGLPGQVPETALADLRGALGLAPGHLSWYQLTLEPNTLFAAQPPAGLPGEDHLADIAEAGQALLAEAGYRRYEISAYGADGRECRHNRHYWEFGDYLGIGAGAHGKLTGPDGVRRSAKQRHPAAYLSSARQGALSSERAVGPAELPVEFAMNALRLVDGVPLALFRQRTALPATAIAGPVATARQRGLLAHDLRRLQATPLGLCFLNDLVALFDADRGETVDATTFVRADCPYCGEPIELAVDFSAGSQEYVEDCPVCCRPIEVQLLADGEDRGVALKRDDE